uniref:Peptidase S1 domain-containing protein n=1 Tax=Monodelphis domestica TaxID=13616 RepID=A0A5F8G2R7_MONDO
SIQMIFLLLLTLPLLGSSVYPFLYPDRSKVNIVGGDEAQEGEWPWQISLRLNLNGSWIHLCWGSLIHPSWILTTAPCFASGQTDPSQYMIQVRQQNLYDEDNLLPVDQIIIHPHCIGLWTADCNIQPITLPSSSETFTSDLECWVTGWGDIEPGGGEPLHMPPPYTLRKVQVPVMDAQTCDKEYHVNSTISPSERIILDNMICSGEAGRNPCKGDSGGAVVCKAQGSWHQAGIVSWGECCGAHRPGVYTLFPLFVDLINEHIQGSCGPVFPSLL